MTGRKGKLVCPANHIRQLKGVACVTGTQHAPVESQIERVSSVSAQLAPDRHAELSWHQTDTKPAMQRTGQYKPVTTPIGGRNHPYFSSERAASSLLHLLPLRFRRTNALSTRELHTAQGQHQQRAQHPDTQRQVVRDTPIIYSRHARLASRPVREPGSEPDPVDRAGLTVAGLASHPCPAHGGRDGADHVRAQLCSTG